MFRRKSRQATDTPAAIFEGLRAAALDVTEAVVGQPLSEHSDVLATVIDIPGHGGTATVVAMADGTTSMYTSTGGGTIGAGQHASAAGATRALLITVQQLLDLFPPDDRTDLPPSDLVQVTVITPRGRRRANVPITAFWGQEPSTVVELIAAIHDVITAIQRVKDP